MNISEDQLKKLVLRVLKELETERTEADGKRQKLYMLCMNCWNEGYGEFLGAMESPDCFDIYPVIPLSWQKKGYEEKLKKYKSCSGIVYRSCEQPQDLGDAVTVFPIVPRDVLVKTALCLSDTFETSWIASCIEYGSRIVFLRSGLARFSGREQAAYVSRIMEYYRQVLEYGIEIRGTEELYAWGDKEITGTDAAWDVRKSDKPVQQPVRLVMPEFVTQHSGASNLGKKRVITSSNVEKLSSGGVLYLQPGDIITDLAKDRAKFLKIVFK